MTVATALISLTLLGTAIAALLTWANRMLPDAEDDIADSINALLPQTQCGQCGYPGCRPYAEAISQGEPINRCPPGGDQTIRALAELLGREATELDPSLPAEENTVAVIREPACIGCTLCIQACPVDAIAGAPQKMHVVITELCTGCDLCLAPCPVDCIDMVPA